jgi:hypothetical protein
MNSKKKAWAVAVALLASGVAQATCYSVYKSDGTLIQEGSTTPVNLSLQLGDTVPEKFGPGALMMVSDNDFFCKDRRGERVLPNAPAAATTTAEEKRPEAAGKQAAGPEAASVAAR